jgi:mannose-6-phosphate isomerase-like protein (cupin superfamily)
LGTTLKIRSAYAEKVMTLNENQSTFIPQGQTHRLANPGTEPLEMIEVQSGVIWAQMT